MDSFKKLVTGTLLSGLIFGAMPLQATVPKTEHDAFLELNRENFAQYVDQKYPGHSPAQKAQEIENILVFQKNVREQKTAASGYQSKIEQDKKALQVCHNVLSAPKAQPQAQIPPQKIQQATPINSVQQPVQQPAQVLGTSGAQQDVKAAQKFIEFTMLQGQAQAQALQEKKQYTPPQLTPAQQQEMQHNAQAFAQLSPDNVGALVQAMGIPAEHQNQAKQEFLNTQQQIKQASGTQAAGSSAQAQQPTASQGTPVESLVQNTPDQNQQNAATPQTPIDAQQQIKAAQKFIEFTTAQGQAQMQALQEKKEYTPPQLTAEEQQALSQGAEAFLNLSSEQIGHMVQAMGIIDKDQSQAKINFLQMQQHMKRQQQAFPFVMYTLQEQGLKAQHAEQNKDNPLALPLEETPMTADQKVALKKSARVFAYLEEQELNELVQKLPVPQEQMAALKEMLVNIQKGERVRLENKKSWLRGPVIDYIKVPALRAFVAAPLVQYAGLESSSRLWGAVGTGARLITEPTSVQAVQAITNFSKPLALFSYTLGKSMLQSAVESVVEGTADFFGITKPLMGWLYGAEYVKVYEEGQRRDARAMMAYKEKLREYHEAPAYQAYKKAQQEYEEALVKNPDFKGKKPRKPLQNRPVKPKQTEIPITQEIGMTKQYVNFAKNIAIGKLIDMSLLAVAAACAKPLAIAAVVQTV